MELFKSECNTNFVKVAKYTLKKEMTALLYGLDVLRIVELVKEQLPDQSLLGQRQCQN